MGRSPSPSSKATRATLLALALVAAFGAPGVVLAATGILDFAADDYWQLCGLAGHSYPGGPDADAMFRFFSGVRSEGEAAMRVGAYPWYADPTVKLNFWRPLTSATHLLDYSLFGTRAAGAKLHSLLWYMALVAVVSRLYHRLLPGRAALFGLLIFALAAPHWQIVAWLAARNATITAVFAVITLELHLRWREDGWRPGLPLSLVALAGALAAGEAALGVLGYLFAFELTRREEPLTRRALALSPAALLTVVWLIAWLAQGYGTENSSTYLNPFEEPLPYVRQLPLRLASMIGMALLAFPADLWILEPDTRPIATACGVLGIVVMAPLWRAAWRRLDTPMRRTLVWLTIGSVVAMVPQAAGFLGARSLTLPSVGSCAAIALCLVSAWQTRTQARGARRLVSGVAIIAVGVANTLFAAGSWIGSYVIYAHMSTETSAMARSLVFDAPEAEADGMVIVLQAPDPFIGRYFPYQRRVMGLPTPQNWRVLSLARSDHRVHRTGERSFELEVIDGHMIDTPLEKLFRPPNTPLDSGYEVDTGALHAEVLETDDHGPTRVAFELDRSIDDHTVWFLAWDRGRLRHHGMPAIGHSQTIAWTPGPTNL